MRLGAEGESGAAIWIVGGGETRLLAGDSGNNGSGRRLGDGEAIREQESDWRR